MGKKERTAKSRQESDILDRVLLWFGISLIFELYLLALNRYCFYYRVSEIEIAEVLHKTVLPALTYVGLIGLIASIVWAVAGRKNRSRLLPAAAGFFSGGLSVSGFLSRNYGQVSIQVLQVIVPVIAVLALVYYLYQKEFFVITVLCGLCIFGLWLYRRAGDTHAALCYGYMSFFAVLLVAAAVIARILQREEGMLTLGTRQYRIFQRKAAYGMLYITCALAALAAVVTLAVGAAAAYCAILVLVAWIFVMAVYYTVRLM